MTKYILMTLGLVTAVGCGGGGDTLTEQQTMQALTAVASASGSGFSAANGQIQQGAQGQVTINATAGCLNGGSVTADGRVTVNSSSFSYDLGIAMASCKVSNITMDGNIDLAGSGSSTQFELDLDGRVTFTGDVSGTCVFNLTQSYDQSTGRFRYSGRACNRSINLEFNTGG